jgi:predicted Rossmann fold nucleotide-binding protein DprA/Smf involved in DNA uptake
MSDVKKVKKVKKVKTEKEFEPENNKEEKEKKENEKDNQEQLQKQLKELAISKGFYAKDVVWNLSFPACQEYITLSEYSNCLIQIILANLPINVTYTLQLNNQTSNLRSDKYGVLTIDHLTDDDVLAPYVLFYNGIKVLCYNDNKVRVVFSRKLENDELNSLQGNYRTITFV